MGADPASQSNYVNSNVRAVGGSEDPGLEMRECVDGSSATATKEVKPQSNSSRPCAVSSILRESQNSREETCDNSEA